MNNDRRCDTCVYYTTTFCVNFDCNNCPLHENSEYGCKCVKFYSTAAIDDECPYYVRYKEDDTRQN